MMQPPQPYNPNLTRVPLRVHFRGVVYMVKAGTCIASIADLSHLVEIISATTITKPIRFALSNVLFNDTSVLRDATPHEVIDILEEIVVKERNRLKVQIDDSQLGYLSGNVPISSIAELVAAISRIIGCGDIASANSVVSVNNVILQSIDALDRCAPNDLVKVTTTGTPIIASPAPEQFEKSRKGFIFWDICNCLPYKNSDVSKLFPIIQREVASRFGITDSIEWVKEFPDPFNTSKTFPLVQNQRSLLIAKQGWKANPMTQQGEDDHYLISELNKVQLIAEQCKKAGDLLPVVVLLTGDCDFHGPINSLKAISNPFLLIHKKAMNNGFLTVIPERNRFLWESVLDEMLPNGEQPDLHYPTGPKASQVPFLRTASPQPPHLNPTSMSPQAGYKKKLQGSSPQPPRRSPSPSPDSRPPSPNPRSLSPQPRSLSPQPPICVPNASLTAMETAPGVIEDSNAKVAFLATYYFSLKDPELSGVKIDCDILKRTIKVSPKPQTVDVQAVQKATTRLLGILGGLGEVEVKRFNKGDLAADDPIFDPSRKVPVDNEFFVDTANLRLMQWSHDFVRQFGGSNLNRDLQIRNKVGMATILGCNFFVAYEDHNKATVEFVKSLFAADGSANPRLTPMQVHLFVPRRVFEYIANNEIAQAEIEKLAKVESVAIQWLSTNQPVFIRRPDGEREPAILSAKYWNKDTQKIMWKALIGGQFKTGIVETNVERDYAILEHLTPQGEQRYPVTLMGFTKDTIERAAISIIQWMNSNI